LEDSKVKITAVPSYNLDVLCFLNVMTSDEYYVKRHREAYNKFYPLLSPDTKANMEEAVKAFGSSMISPTAALLISSLADFGSRDLIQMLISRTEIEEQIGKSPYRFTRDELDGLLNSFKAHLVPAVLELERAGFRDYWKNERLPSITQKCDEINGYFKKFDIRDLILSFKDFKDEDITVYICSLAAPHGIKLCGYSLISDMSYRNETILANVSHEMFHPPYDLKKVQSSVQALARKKWVRDAFLNQDPHSGYAEMNGFIEENVVEALGTYIVYKIEAEADPYGYFEKHDGGSHVISPRLFRYLLENPKDREQPFEDYFNGFAASLE
jgi:hypothetical protein